LGLGGAEPVESALADQVAFHIGGRRVATDLRRPHTPVNYMIQGAARDLFADALLRIADAGLASRCGSSCTTRSS
jgi:hypothetical protein